MTHVYGRVEEATQKYSDTGNFGSIRDCGIDYVLWGFLLNEYIATFLCTERLESIWRNNSIISDLLFICSPVAFYLSIFKKISWKPFVTYSYLDERSPDAQYVDLLLNPERYTGYKGPSAWRVWNSIYEENCFK